MLVRQNEVKVFSHRTEGGKKLRASVRGERGVLENPKERDPCLIKDWGIIEKL